MQILCSCLVFFLLCPTYVFISHRHSVYDTREFWSWFRWSFTILFICMCFSLVWNNNNSALELNIRVTCLSSHCVILCNLYRVFFFFLTPVAVPVGCGTRAADLLDSLDSRALVLCPGNCTLWKLSVFGSGIYASISSVCGAALHRYLDLNK